MSRQLYVSVDAAKRAWSDKWQWKNFKIEEVACKGTGQVLIDTQFLDKVQLLRNVYGKPMTITSWYRDPNYNAQVSTTGITGPHTTGRAIDIAVARGDCWFFLKEAFLMGFTGIGVNQKGQGRFIHLDDLMPPEHSPRPTVWSY